MDDSVPYRDLREWLEKVEALGELVRFRGAHWRLEMGGITEIIYRGPKQPKPAILFEAIPGYPPQQRALFGLLGSVRRLALTLGMPLDYDTPIAFVRACRDHLRALRPLPPVPVASSALLDDEHAGDDIDLLEFPVPLHHEDDGGRYLGTAHAVITRDPDTGWVNLGTYRVMFHDQRTLGVHMLPGRHGALHLQAAMRRGEPLPVAVAIGVDPALYLAASMEVPAGLSEYDYAGGLRGRPLEVLTGPATGLPLPAEAEIVVEGEVRPGELRDEGPFGEWCGYYANNGLRPVPEPVIHVQRVLHRRDPIFTGGHPNRPPHEFVFSRMIMRSAMVWDAIEQAGLPGVRGVWCPEAGASRFLIVVAITQLYPGHAKQAGMMAAQCLPGALSCRYVIVVDEDIDPASTDDVLWALCTRSDPATSIDILRECWSSSADPMIPPGGGHAGVNSRAIIEACRPYEWRQDFPPVAEISPALRAALVEKFGREALGLA